MAAAAGGFVPPPYPFDRLDEVRAKAEAHEGGVVELAAGIPVDAPSPAVVAALAESGAERAYPASPGTPRLRQAAAAWIARRFGVEVDPAHVAACVGTKELVASTAQYLRLRSPQRDVVLFPGLAYPTYEMGAILGGCRPVAVPVDDRGRLDLAAVAPHDAERALCLWVNSPGNPAGQIDDLDAVAVWGRERGVPVLSDECYAEMTWSGPPRTILAGGRDGVVAVHSISKRSNLAGLRVGFYAGDPELVTYLAEVRKHAGLMVPGPAQHAGAVALDDDAFAAEQAGRYRRRLERLAEVIGAAYDLDVAQPDGGIYLWIAAPEGDAWAFTERLAVDAGVVVSPGEFYGPAGAGHVRVAAVATDDRIELAARRLGAA